MFDARTVRCANRCSEVSMFDARTISFDVNARTIRFFEVSMFDARTIRCSEVSFDARTIRCSEVSMFDARTIRCSMRERFDVRNQTSNELTC